MPDQRVLLFTASGTFRGERGTVLRIANAGVWVRVDERQHPLFFSMREVIPVDERSGHAGAE